MSLFEQLDKLEQAVDQARGAEERVEDARRPLLAASARARAALEAFYAMGADDAKREKALKAAVEKADAAAADSWEERLVGARMQEGLAREQLRSFMRENFAALAAELVPRSRAAGERFERARAELVDALREKVALLDLWRPLLGPSGIPVADLPPADSLEPPLPRSLAGLASDREAVEA
jgi:hypothetical protein